VGRKKLVVIDGSSLIYRAFFALPSLTTADGTPTNAVYGFTNMLLKILEDEQPDLILLALEGGRTFRHTEFAGYKSHRPRTPDDLAVQTPIARAVTEAFGIPIIQHRGYEADDVIGTITCRGKAEGYDVLVVTGDHDALQLVNDQVKVFMTQRGVTDARCFDEAGVVERYGLKPEQLPDFKALKGDTSDNIPGIAGIGDKTATSLIGQYGNLEALLEHAEEVKAARVRTNLLEGRQNALLYKRLATIVTDLPLETPWEQWQYGGPDVPRLQQLFHRLEFRTLGRRLEQLFPPKKSGAGADPAATGPVDDAEISFRVLTAGPELDQWVDRAQRAGSVAIRTLQVGGEGRTGALRALALSSSGDTIVLEATEPEGEGLFASEADPFPLPASLRALLEDPSLLVVGHDVKTSYHAFLKKDLRIGRVGFDTMLAAYVLNPGRSNYRLEDLTREFLQQGIGTGEPLDLLAREAALVERLWEPLDQRLKKDELSQVYYQLELPLICLLGDMEALGVGVDCTELRNLSRRLAERIAELEHKAHEIAGKPFNLGSPKQLQEILFVELGLPSGRKTKTGYSTDSDTLQDIAAVHPLPAIILEYREVAKLKSTYADALQSLVDPQDGRVHTHLNQTVAATGRLSSSDPNLQNIPIRTEVGREIRAAFVPAPGMKLLSADYSQIELRLMAHVTGDPELVRAFREGRDVHTATAAKVFAVPLDQVTSSQRRSAKTVNFAVMYGQKDFGLSRQLRIPLKEAHDLIEAYFAEFPGVQQFTEDTLNQARQDGYVTTLPPYRRKRYTPGIHAGNRNERLSAEREAVNAPIQGTAADVIKIAMIKVAAAMKEAGVRSRMILQVHDELLFEIVPEEEDQMLRLVAHEMEHAYALQVPLVVETKVGCNWRDVEPTAFAE
jgi:DNA polymerase-1